MVIDMEGFFIPYFICRELGTANVYGGFTNNMYSPPLKYIELDSKQIRQVQYVRRRIHGLQFTPSSFEDAKSQEFLKIDVQNLYNTYKSGKRDLVAYKGGHIEKDLLKVLNIPSVNLEDFGCPKVHDLIHQGYGYEVWDCGLHGCTTVSGMHCATLECQILMEWIEDRKQKLGHALAHDETM